MADYTAKPNKFTVQITSETGISETQANLNLKENGSSMCRHSCRYQASSRQYEQLELDRNDLFQLCLNLVKKIQNINCEDKFHCLASRNPTQDTHNTGGENDLKDQLKFEASTMNICPLDFSRLLLKIGQTNTGSETTEKVVSLTILMPNTNFKIRAIPQMKLVSTPLSRMLLGKSKESQQPFALPASGFITLDSEERVIPLMP